MDHQKEKGIMGYSGDQKDATSSGAAGQAGPSKKNKAVIGLGANLNSPRDNILSAIEALNGLIDTRVSAISSMYKTKPVGFLDQPDFINAVALIETALSPKILLGALLGIESVLGRRRSFTYAPRVIDLDLLLYENYNCRTDELTLPHPLMAERAFVLVPLADIFPSKVALGYNFAADYRNTIKTDVVLLDQTQR